MPDWPATYATLSDRDREHELPAADLERLAVAAFMLGRDAEVVPLRERAVDDYLRAGRRDEAARCGFWISWHHMICGEIAQAQGWAARLVRLIGEGDHRLEAMLVQQSALARMWSGDAAPALAAFGRAADSAARDSLTDVFVLSLLGRARCLQMLDRLMASTAVLDEAMTYVTAGKVQPQVSGLLYCAAIDLSLGRCDIARAQEWTRALSSWLSDQAGAVPYRGACLIHRAEILQLRGAWTEAAEQAEEACAVLANRPEPMEPDAHYRLGELARLRGDLDTAEAAYGRAAERGLDVQPGLALLRLAQGRPDAALAGIERALADDPADRRARFLQLAAKAEICVAVGETSQAQETVRALGRLDDGAQPYLQATVARCEGLVLLATGDPRAALPRLRRAWTWWRALEAPYEGACTRILVARACEALGDTDAAAMEADAARADLDRLGAVMPYGSPTESHGDEPLSPRELEVLRLVATGATNREIANALFLSEKTVARHVSNIFAKLDVPNRASATAYAFEHRLI